MIIVDRGLSIANLQGLYPRKGFAPKVPKVPKMPAAAPLPTGDAADQSWLRSFSIIDHRRRLPLQCPLCTWAAGLVRGGFVAVAAFPDLLDPGRDLLPRPGNSQSPLAPHHGGRLHRLPGHAP